MKYLLSLMLVATFVCETVYNSFTLTIERCENNEIVCYIQKFNGGISCKFKEQEQ